MEGVGSGQESRQTLNEERTKIFELEAMPLMGARVANRTFLLLFQNYCRSSEMRSEKALNALFLHFCLSMMDKSLVIWRADGRGETGKYMCKVQKIICMGL